MALIHDIHRQPPRVRTLLWALSAFTTLSVVGFFWFSSMERQLFSALHEDPEEQAAFAQRQDDRTPEVFGAIGKAFGSLAASIGGAVGIDAQDGFDRQEPEDTVYLLPLSR